ncbi:Calcium-binding protein CML42 [Vitis vinifera]|nr:Calcium-binding protein CML42 [Vitis vinifera]
MESGGAGRRSLSINNRSFRLRCPSLNSVRLRRIFDLFDKNSDGTITVTELSQALALLGLDADLPDLQSIVQSHIKPGNLGLEFDDFAALHLS